METVNIICRCKDCRYSEKQGKELYCYFWDYETGMSPNTVDEMGFCNNAEIKQIWNNESKKWEDISTK